MKKLLIVVGGIVLLIIVVAILLPFLIPVERYKQEIATQVKENTGRDFAIAGPLTLSLFPNIALNAEQVSLANAPGRAEPLMAQLDKLHISVKLLPLLKGSIAIDGFELVRPVIHLDVDKAGHGNWEFEGKATAAPAAEAPKETAGSEFFRELKLGKVRVTDGLITYFDGKTGKKTELSKVNVNLGLPNYDGPLKLDGDLVWNAEKITLNVTTANLKGLIDGQQQAISAKVSSAPVTFSLDGTATKGQTLAADGAVKLDVPSVRKLAAWLEQPIAMPGDGLGPLKLEGQLKLADKKYAFENATLSLDAIHAKGGVAVSTSGARPMITGTLATDNLDFNPYLPPETKAEKTATATGWSSEPIDLSGLKAADLALIFETQSLKMRKITIGQSKLTLAIKDGDLKADLKEMALYNGTGKGSLEVKAGGGVPAIHAVFDLEKVAAEPLLADAGDFTRLSGTLATNFTLNATGHSQKELVSTLAGNGAFKFADGTLKGVDLAAIAETIEGISNGVQSGGANMLQSLVSGDLLGSLKSVASIFGGKGEVDKSTKFSSLNGTWQASGGTVTNNDLVLMGPLVNQRALFKMTGKGQIMLPLEQLNYEAEIRSFAKEAAGTGIGGTVRLTGALADPSPCVVVGSLCIGKETKPADLLKGNLKSLIPGLGGSKEQAPTGAPAESPGEKLKKGLEGLIPKR